MLVVGPQAKPYKALQATVKLADLSKYATAVYPNAKVGSCWPWIHMFSNSHCTLHLTRELHILALPLLHALLA